ncbi:MAG: hypothetical protein U0638_17275 [Phycisphaerales bacterium]
MTHAITFSAIAAALVAHSATAQEAAPAIGLPDSGDGRITLSFTPYAWLTSYSGTSGFGGIEMGLEAPFTKILGESDSILGLMGAVDLEKDRLVFHVNGAFAKAEFSRARGKARDGLIADTTVNVSSRVVAENAWFEGFAGYRVIDSAIGQSGENRFRLDAFGGLRYSMLSVDADVTADANVTLPSGELLQAGVQRSLGDNAGWVEPFVGLRASTHLGKNWRALVQADTGGFGVDGSNSAWQLIGAVGYNWSFENWSLGLFGGYRALWQDYEGSGMVWDVVTHGPIVGLQATTRF